MSSKAKFHVFSVLLLLFAVLSPFALAQDEAASEPAASPSVDPAVAFHGLGLMISQQLGPLSVTDSELEHVIKGIREGLAGNSDVDPRKIMPMVQALAAERTKKAGDAERQASADFLTKKTAEAKAAGGQVTDSGLIYTELVAGTGESPAATDKVKVHYHGTLRTGEVFDSSRDRGEPITFGLNQVIKCWTEGVQMMKTGGKAELVCPADIAYGDRAPGKIPPGSVLIFEVELLGIEKAAS